MDGLQKSIVMWRNRRCNSANSNPIGDTISVQYTESRQVTYGSFISDSEDAIPYGKTAESISSWKEFFGYKPCLFKNGAVVGYLDPNDYTKFEDGTAADITSGNAGDVMIEFPRRGIKISKSGTTVTVSMTKANNVSGYSYNAHNRGTTKKDNFYIGAYFGTLDSKKRLRSISGKTLTSGTGLPSLKYERDIHKYTTANGTGYSEIGFYQWVYLQVMYMLQFKGNRNSQSMIGLGSPPSSEVTTGTLNNSGLVYGSSENYESVKLFGIENIFGLGLNIPISGLYIIGNDILTTTNPSNFSNFNDCTVVGSYSNIVAGVSGLIGTCACSNALGFIPSGSPYRDSGFNFGGPNYDICYCDSGSWGPCYESDDSPKAAFIYVGRGEGTKEAGIFRISDSTYDSLYGLNGGTGRLMYL